MKFKCLYRSLLIATAVMMSANAFAEVLRVESEAELMPQNLYASTHPRTDSKGKTCGLLLVNSTLPGLAFDNKVAVGNVEYKSGTYYVYLSPGTKNLTVGDASGNKLKLTLPPIQSKATYEVLVYEGEERGRLEIKSDPSGATVKLIVPGESRPISLGTTPIKKENASLKVGNYTVEISKNGYQTVEKKIKIQSGKKTNLGTIKLKRKK